VINKKNAEYSFNTRHVCTVVIKHSRCTEVKTSGHRKCYGQIAVQPRCKSHDLIWKVF